MSNDLILEYQKNPTPELEQKLLDAHRPFISAQTNKWKGIVPDIVIDTKAKNYAVQAFKTFDPTKANINTHLYNNLSQLSRTVYQYQNVSTLPEHQVRLIGTVDTAKNYLTDELGREPSISEIADHLSLPPIHVKRIIENTRKDLLYDTEQGSITHSTTDTSPLLNRLISLRAKLPKKEKEQLDDIVGYEKDPLSPGAFGKKWKLKPYQVSRLKTHFTKQIKED